MDKQLQIIKETELIEDSLYQRYVDAITVWANRGYEILEMIETGDRDGAVNAILTECSPALEELIVISQELDAVADELMEQSVSRSQIIFILIMICIIIFIVIAIVSAVQISKRIVKSITDPLTQIEHVAKELTEGNLHSQIQYRSQDEIGNLAHSLRKSIRILGSYVDDIAWAMEEFSQGNFAVKPTVEWKGDFVAIRNAFMTFEKSMAETVREIQRVADQVSALASQSAEAAKESAVLIEASMRAVEKGITIADETAQQLEQVLASSRIVTEEVGRVADALEAQNESFAQINVGVEHINDVVQTNSATSEECAAASQEMNSQATVLKEAVGKFRVAAIEE